MAYKTTKLLLPRGRRIPRRPRYGYGTAPDRLSKVERKALLIGNTDEADAIEMLTSYNGFMVRPWQTDEMFTDTAGNTVAVNNDPIARINTNLAGVNAQQSTLNSRPLLKLENGLYSIQSDGLNDSLIFQAATAFGNASTIIIGMAKFSAGQIVNRIYGTTASSTFSAAWRDFEFADFTFNGTTVGQTRIISPALTNVTVPRVITCRRSQPLNIATIRDNGVEVVSTTHTFTGASVTLNLFARNGGTTDISALKLYAFVVVPSVMLSNEEVELVERVIANRLAA